MTSPDPIPTTLSDQLRQLGLAHTASDVNDLIARATQKRWSPVVQLERLVQAELEARLRHRVERRLRGVEERSAMDVLSAVYIDLPTISPRE